ncbi:MAG: hypothetical protein JJU12_00405 [Chlamydiales bacterium]|nr:hypothetical protein [Chlamydiales bacterium]
MSTPTNLLTLEVGGGYEVFESATSEDNHEAVPLGHEKDASEEVVVIRGTLTVSP